MKGATHADSPGSLPLRLHEEGDEVSPADDDLAEGLPRRGEAEDAGGEVTELAGAEVRLLDVEADDLFLDVIGGAVPGPTAPARRRLDRKPVALRPAAIEATKGAAPPAGVARQPLAVILNGKRDPEQELDDGEAEPVVAAEEDVHATKGGPVTGAGQHTGQ